MFPYEHEKKNKSNNSFLLWGWLNSERGDPGRLWSFHPWKYLKHFWMQSRTTGSTWPCFNRGVMPVDLQRFFLSPAILWFCECYSLSLCYVGSWPEGAEAIHDVDLCHQGPGHLAPSSEGLWHRFHCHCPAGEATVREGVKHIKTPFSLPLWDCFSIPRKATCICFKSLYLRKNSSVYSNKEDLKIHGVHVCLGQKCTCLRW